MPVVVCLLRQAGFPVVLPYLYYLVYLQLDSHKNKRKPSDSINLVDSGGEDDSSEPPPSKKARNLSKQHKDSDAQTSGGSGSGGASARADSGAQAKDGSGSGSGNKRKLQSLSARDPSDDGEPRIKVTPSASEESRLVEREHNSLCCACFFVCVTRSVNAWRGD